MANVDVRGHLEVISKNNYEDSVTHNIVEESVVKIHLVTKGGSVLYSRQGQVLVFGFVLESFIILGLLLFFFTQYFCSLKSTIFNLCHCEEFI